mgnify:CR=1 FL=1
MPGWLLAAAALAAATGAWGAELVVNSTGAAADEAGTLPWAVARANANVTDRDTVCSWIYMYAMKERKETKNDGVFVCFCCFFQLPEFYSCFFFFILFFFSV